MSASINAQELYELSFQRPEAQERNRLITEARSKYLEWIEREKTRRDYCRQMEIRADQERLREEVRQRFLFVNPSADEAEFQACWQMVLDDLSRQRASKLLEEKGPMYTPS